MKRLLRYAEFIRKHYQVIIIATVVVGLLLGTVTTAPGWALQGYSQLLTFLMILFISFTITPRQFAPVARQPVAVLAGLLLNFVYMPLLCWTLARLLVHDPQLATGVILVGVVPCAGVAAVWTALLKGDVPLGMAINALTMVLGPFLIPPLMVLLAGSSVAVNLWAMFRQLAVILLIPLVLGVAARWWAERRWNARAYLPLLGAVALIFPLGFLVPHWLGRYAFDWEQRVAVTCSSGMKNLPIAVGLAFASFPRLVGLPVALVFVVQMLTASLFYRYLNLQSPNIRLSRPAATEGDM